MKAAGRLALRNELYSLMIRCLEDPSRVREFERFGEEGRKHQEALKSWFSAVPSPDPLMKQLALAELLFNHGLYFDTHEYLEEAWNAASGNTKTSLQGLIQLGAGLHKLELDPQATRGALELLERGLEKLRASREILGEETVEGISRALGPVLESIKRGSFAFSQIPRLRWSPR